MADPSQALNAQPVIPMILPAVITVIGGIFAGFTGAFFVHRYTRKRERDDAAESRRREFRVFLYQWRSQFSRIDHNDADTAWKHYLTKVDEHYGQIARTRTDFEPFRKFLELAARLGDLRHEQVVSPPSGKRPCDVIADAIDELIRFMEPTNAA